MKQKLLLSLFAATALISSNNYCALPDTSSGAITTAQFQVYISAIESAIEELGVVAGSLDEQLVSDTEETANSFIGSLHAAYPNIATEFFSEVEDLLI